MVIWNVYRNLVINGKQNPFSDKFPVLILAARYHRTEIIKYLIEELLKLDSD